MLSSKEKGRAERITFVKRKRTGFFTYARPTINQISMNMFSNWSNENHLEEQLRKSRKEYSEDL